VQTVRQNEAHDLLGIVISGRLSVLYFFL
jgi:hypothetical protein